MRPDRSAIYLAIGMLVGSAVLSLGLGGALHSVFHLSVHDVRNMVRRLGPWGAPVVTLAIAAIIVFVPIPTIPIEIVAGLAYGIVGGTILVLIGHALGALIAFLIARRFGRPLLRRWLGDGAVAKLDGFASQSGFVYVFFMRLLPLFDFKLVSYAVGLTPMRLRSYMIATTTGIFLPILILDAIGATAAARPREAAIIAAAYSLVVAGTIAYFVVPRRTRVVHVRREHPETAPAARFAGHLRRGGRAVPRGARIAALVDDALCGATTTNDEGLYAVDIEAMEGRTVPGAAVAFLVDGRRAAQSATLPSTPNTVMLDLTVDETSSGLSSAFSEHRQGVATPDRQPPAC